MTLNMRYSKSKYIYDLFEGGEHLLDEAPRVGWVNFFRSKAAGLGVRHRQRSVHEIYCVLGGVLRLEVEDRVVQASTGEVLIVSPGSDHSGIGRLNEIDPCELCWFELSLPTLSKSTALLRELQSQLVRDLGAMKLESFPVSAETQSRFRQLVNEHRQADAKAVITARLTLYTLLLNLLKDHAGALNSRTKHLRGRTPDIQRALELLDADASGKASIAQLAREIGMRLPDFFRAFREETGTTPNEYRLRTRVKAAAELVADSALPISAIARKMGFSSSQYFATVFKKVTDYTPREYRKVFSKQ
jgi:AraC family L-rhamnose operon regulatory protein RhaS